MKNSILIIILLLSCVQNIKGQETSTPTFNLTIKINGLNSNKGKVLIGLYNNKKLFLKQQFKEGRAIILNQKANFLFTDIPKGEYAVSVLHDENNNNKMDTNFIGIPTEDYGCSNNASGFMGPPNYDDAKFTLVIDKVITINI